MTSVENCETDLEAEEMMEAPQVPQEDQESDAGTAVTEGVIEEGGAEVEVVGVEVSMVALNVSRRASTAECMGGGFAFLGLETAYRSTAPSSSVMAEEVVVVVVVVVSGWRG